MHPALLDVYCGAVLERWRLYEEPDRAEADLPGLRGLLGGPGPDPALLVTDDRSYLALVELVATARTGRIQILHTASRSLALLERDERWTESRSTAMVCTELPDGPAGTLPDAVQIRPVRRTADDPTDGVPLGEAVACVVRAAPREDPAPLTAFLERRRDTWLFAAVDEDDTVRATSGYELIGRHARVILVDTDPAWQRRGLGTAMTRVALHHAGAHGAVDASLDSSDPGRSVYAGLGFEAIGSTTRFRLAAPE